MAQPLVLSSSRAVPVDIVTAFQHTLPAPLPSIFRRWYGPIAPVKSTSDTEPPNPAAQNPEAPNPEAPNPETWGHIGQTRTITQVGGGTMREELVDVDAPYSFSYQLTDITGPLSALISHIGGRWSFKSVGTGTEITWQWRLHPRSKAASYAFPMVARFWHGYARQALEELSAVLLADPGYGEPVPHDD
ncbi:MAG: SRPBCC family protein [Gordonia amarae]